jgi:hypothetical protein
MASSAWAMEDARLQPHAAPDALRLRLRQVGAVAEKPPCAFLAVAKA